MILAWPSSLAFILVCGMRAHVEQNSELMGVGVLLSQDRAASRHLFEEVSYHQMVCVSIRESGVEAAVRTLSL